MAKDDYPVIVYQILAYLYQRLKAGKKADPAMLKPESPLFQADGQGLNRQYWGYVIYHLSQSKLVEGIIFADIDNLPYPYPIKLEDCMITPAGIEYLTDNSFLSKAKDFLKDIKEITPFI